MEKTPFAGITVLEPGESIQADNAAFISRDRIEIDRALKIGVVTHRHNGHVGLSNPAVAPSGAVVPSGGTIPAGISLTLGYTLEDGQGGETQLSPTLLVTTPAPFPLPSDAPVATLNTGSGSLDIDTFTYGVTYSDGEGGETPLGPTTTINRPPGFANSKITLSGLLAPMEEAGADAWRLYRARSGGEYVLLATGSTDSFVDDGTTAAQCDVHPPTSGLNTTGGVNQLKFQIPSGLAGSGATWINLYASQSGSFAESCLLMQVPIGSAGATAVFADLELLDWQPPDVNRSYPGANKIDPDTELIDWHWKRPVATTGDLPTGGEGSEAGDTRLVTTEKAIYFYDGTKWEVLTFEGGGKTQEELEDLEALLGESGKGVCLFGENLSKARPVGFASIEWIGKAGEGEKPTHMIEGVDTLILVP